MEQFSLIAALWLVFPLVAIEVSVCFLASGIVFGTQAHLIIMVIAATATRDSLFRAKPPAAHDQLKRVVQSRTYGRNLRTE